MTLEDRLDGLGMATRFEQFDQKNPKVWEMFVRFTQEVKAKGYIRFSADAILHRIRWEATIVTPEGPEDFRINNNYTAYYARKYMQSFPNEKGFFLTRIAKGAA